MELLLPLHSRARMSANKAGTATAKCTGPTDPCRGRTHRGAEGPPGQDFACRSSSLSLPRSFPAWSPAPSPCPWRHGEQVGQSPPCRGWGSLKGSGAARAAGRPSPQQQRACLHAGHRQCVPGPGPGPAGPRGSRTGSWATGSPGGGRGNGGTARRVQSPTPTPRQAYHAFLGGQLSGLHPTAPRVPGAHPPPFSPYVPTKPQRGHKRRV